MNKQMKEKLFNRTDLNVGFHEIFNSLQEEFEKSYESIDTAEKSEIFKIKKDFDKKRKQVESREKRITNELKTYLKNIEKYSTFNIIKDNDIMDILVDIVSLYKGEQYDCMFFYNEKRAQDDLIFYPERINITYEKNLSDLIEDGIVLSFADDYLIKDNKINFYELDIDGANLSKLIINDLRPMNLLISNNSKTNKFILEFINLVVKYRMEKQSDDISFVELKRLEQAFICSKQTEIEALNRKRSQEERDELEKKIQERDALLDKYIDDNFDVIDELPSEVALGNVTSGKVLRKLIEKYNETCEE